MLIVLRLRENSLRFQRLSYYLHAEEKQMDGILQ